MVHRFRNLGARKPGAGALAQSLLDDTDWVRWSGYAPIGLHELGFRRMDVGMRLRRPAATEAGVGKI